MKLLVVGGGGREHAIIKKLKENPEIEEIFALPGNGGIARDATCVPIGAKDLDGIVRFAREQGVEFAVVAPDDPLVLGAVDRLQAAAERLGRTAVAAFPDSDTAQRYDRLARAMLAASEDVI